MRGSTPPLDSSRAFGGRWTEERLDALESYLRAYTKALKKQPFTLVYIDAFAGPGWATRRPTGPRNAPEALEVDDTSYREGSPRRALKVGGFDRYIFVDKNRRATQALAALREEFPALAAQIEIIEGDANVEIPKLCRSLDWTQTRGVVYFDPFGLQLAWATLEAVAGTKLDVWLLFPIGTANRLISRTGEIDPTWASALDRLLGVSTWREAMYQEAGEQLGSNGTADDVRRRAAWRRLLEFVTARLSDVFPGRVADPVVQLNSRKAPLFAVFFAVANSDTRAWGLASNIAGAILKKLERPDQVPW